MLLRRSRTGPKAAGASGGSGKGLARLISLMPLLGLLGCQAQPSRSVPPLTRVRTQAVQQQSFVESYTSVATLEAVEEVNLASQAGGRIKRLLMRQGDRVRAGQLLMVLDQAQDQAEVARLRAEVETNRLNDHRYDYLVREGAESAIRRDAFHQQYIASRQALIAKEADLQFRDLRAPIDGIVADLQVKVGDVITAGAPFTRIIRNDRLVARLEVPAVYGERLRLGQLVTLMDPASGRPLARGEIRSLDPGVATGSQALLAKAEFANPQGLLRHGLRTQVRLEFSQRDLPAVPFTAVTRMAGQSFVFVLGRAAELPPSSGSAGISPKRRLRSDTLVALQRPVKLGSLQNKYYPVLSGLAVGDRLIISGLINLSNGKPVRSD